MELKTAQEMVRNQAQSPAKRLFLAHGVEISAMN
jgi:hypothetical protein